MIKTKKIYDLIVIGAGAGGLTVAIGGAKSGANVLLIEKENKLGGDCTHYGCIPSKTFITLSKQFKNSKDIADTFKKVKSNVKKIEKKSESFEYVISLGINLIIGTAVLFDENTIKINNKKFYGKNIVIATGANALIPKIKGLNKIKYLTNKSIFKIKEMKSLAIIGAGPIGCELGQAFNRIGINVTIINQEKNILPQEDIEATKIIQKQLRDEGINISNNVKIVEITKKNNKKIIMLNTKKIVCDEVLIATGRRPDLEELKLEKIGIKHNKEGIKINSKCQTNIKNIYAIGDCTKGPKFTHLANYQGKITLANTLFKYSKRYSTKTLPRVTFTDPPIASVGKLKGFELKKEYKNIDKAITDFQEDGFIKIFVKNSGYINGAVIVGQGAEEMISQITLAMKNDLKITDISDTIYPYPTYSYGLRECADLFTILKYTPMKKKWAQKIFGFGKK